MSERHEVAERTIAFQWSSHAIGIEGNARQVCRPRSRLGGRNASASRGPLE